MPKSRVTLGQIAARAGVHITTVSLALRDSPRLPFATRSRLQSLARDMGYAPDAALSSLVAYRNNIQAPAYQATIAWFNSYPQRHRPLNACWFKDYIDGATERANELGYKLEEFWLAGQGPVGPALGRRLLARGIRSVLVLPLETPGAIPDFPWSDFTALALGYSLQNPQLHRVTVHQFRSALNLLRELRHLGYRRIGFFVPEAFDRRLNLGPSTAYAAYDRTIPDEERVPMLAQRYFNDTHGLGEWIDRHRPEVVVTQDVFLWDWFITRQIRVPQDIGLAFLNVNRSEKILSGMNQSELQIGRAAVDLIVAMIHRNERGIPSVAQHVLLDGEWFPHQTTRKVGPPAPWFLDMPLGPENPPTAAPASPASPAASAPKARLSDLQRKAPSSRQPALVRVKHKKKKKT
jgi:LacI family transcriptional regulator